jgi:hypothetical protein
MRRSGVIRSFAFPACCVTAEPAMNAINKNKASPLWDYGRRASGWADNENPATGFHRAGPDPWRLYIRARLGIEILVARAYVKLATPIVPGALCALVAVAVLWRRCRIGGDIWPRQWVGCEGSFAEMVSGEASVSIGHAGDLWINNMAGTTSRAVCPCNKNPTSFDKTIRRGPPTAQLIPQASPAGTPGGPRPALPCQRSVCRISTDYYRHWRSWTARSQAVLRMLRTCLRGGTETGLRVSSAFPAFSGAARHLA